MEKENKEMGLSVKRSLVLVDHSAPTQTMNRLVPNMMKCKEIPKRPY